MYVYIDRPDSNLSLSGCSDIACDVATVLRSIPVSYHPDTGVRAYVIDGETFDAVVADVSAIAELRKPTSDA